MRCTRTKTAVRLVRLLPIALLGLPSLASAQTDPFASMALDPNALSALEPRQAAATILREMQARDSARKRDVTQYAVRSHNSISAMAGGLGLGDQSTMQLYEKVSCPGPTGSGQTTAWRMAPPAEGLARDSGQIDQRLASEGLPAGLLSGLGGSGSSDVGMSSYSLFFEPSADARDLADDPSGVAAVCAAARSQSEISDQARYAGEETIDGRTAVLVEVTGIDSTQAMEGGVEVTMNTATLVVDAERAVPLSMRFAGTVNQQRDSRPILIERKALDYRNVPGSDLYESYRQVLSIAGWSELGPEAAEAQQQLAELEKQLASVPEAQRVMMERMLGSQLDMVRKMASGGAFEFEVIVDEIVVDPGIPGGPASTVSP